jgi:hypothetical protein
MASPINAAGHCQLGKPSSLTIVAYANQAHLQMVGIFVRNALSKAAEPTICLAAIIDTAVDSRAYGDWYVEITSRLSNL